MGVVHHSNHIRYFEEARLDFMRTIGCDAAEMEKDGIIIPNVDAYAKYEKPVRFADRVSIAVRLVKFSGATIRSPKVISAIWDALGRRAYRLD